MLESLRNRGLFVFWNLPYICPMSQVQLLMLPFGGGNETSYQKFYPLLDSAIVPVTGEAPGKGRRIKEPLPKNIHLITDAYFEQWKNTIREPYAIYGHSMGAYLGHLLIHRFREAGLPLPVHFFVTSKIAPSLNYNKKRSVYTSDEFINHLRDLKGMPDAILNNPELLNIFLPVVRADFDAIDNYRYQAKPPYAVPLSVMAGSDEDVPDETLSSWAKESEPGVTFFQRFPGHHFWIFDHLPTLCSHINETLSPYFSK